MCILYIGDIIKHNGPSSVDIALLDEFNRNKIKVKFFQANSRNFFKLIIMILQSNVVHCSGVCFSGVVAFFISKVFFKKCTFTMHGFLKKEAEFRYLTKVQLYNESILMLLANRIFPVSYSLASLVDKYKYKITVIPNGIDDNKKTELKNKDINLITCVGGGRIEKNHYEVFRVIEYLNKNLNLNIKVNLFGEHGPETKYFKQFDFLTDFGFSDKQHVISSLDESCIFIQNSKYEPFSLAIVDAIQSHCYVISSNNVGANYFIEESDGFSISLDEKDLIDKIIYLININRFGFVNPKIKYKFMSWNEVSFQYLKNWEI